MNRRTRRRSLGAVAGGLGCVASTLAFAMPVFATVDLVELVESTDDAQGPVFSISRFAVSGGQVAVQLTTGGAVQVPAISVFAPGSPEVRVVDGQTVPPGFTSTCDWPALGHLSEGTVFFDCASQTDPGMFGTYAWANGAWTTLVNAAGGVPGRSDPLLGTTVTPPTGVASAARVLFPASTASVPGWDGALLGSVGGPSLVAATDGSFPGSLAAPTALDGVALDGTTWATRWLTALSEQGIFVDAGSGLELWASTQDLVPGSTETFASIDRHFELSAGVLVFAGERAPRRGLYAAVGGAGPIEVVADTTTLDPVGGQPLTGVGQWLWRHVAGRTVFTAAPAGSGTAIYVEQGGVVSMLVAPGTTLPGSSSPVDFVVDLAASDEMIVFQVAHLDGSHSVHARTDEGTERIVRTGDVLEAGVVQAIELDDAGIDGHRVAFLATHVGGKALYLATVAVPAVPVLTGPGWLVLAVLLVATTPGLVRSGLR